MQFSIPKSMRVRINKCLMLGLVGGLMGATSPVGAATNAPEKKGLFGSHETISHQMVAFKKWNSMLKRTQADEKDPEAYAATCPLQLRKRCQLESWRLLIAALKDKDGPTQIEEINLQMNKAPYITDMRNWGVPDYWATLRQFFRKDGDCEDYAIAKYLSLKELGFDADSMRIVVVQDTNLDVPHAVLVVTLGDDRLVLDNQISYVVKEKAVLHYKPLYSINENAWWLHRM